MTTQRSAPIDAVEGASATPICAVTLDSYRMAPEVGFAAIAADLGQCADPQVAAVLVECATSIGRYGVAELALRIADDPAGFLRAQLHMVQDQPEAALLALTGRPTDARHLVRSFGLRIRANVLTGRYSDAVDAACDWATALPHSPTPFKVLARQLREMRDPRAKIWFAYGERLAGQTPHHGAHLVDVA